MTEAEESPKLSTLPIDLLTDNIFPYLSITDLAHLSLTSRDFHLLISGSNSEVVWRRRAHQDFHFPTTNAGRRSGWLSLYKRLYRSSCFVWGNKQNGRLGLSPEAEGKIRHTIIQGGATVPIQLSLPSPVVGLESGGFSFHALTTEGKVLCWGTMNGEEYVRNDHLRNPGQQVNIPIWLPQSASGAIGEIDQLGAGRCHAVMRNSEGEVWEYRSFGRAYQVQDSQQKWGKKFGAGKAVASIEAGWDHSLVLTTCGNAFIWWELPPALLDRLANSAGEDISNKSSGVAFTAEVETLQLPSLPSPPSSNIFKSTPKSPEKITNLASGDGFVIALTSFHQLYYLNVTNIPLAGQRLMPAGSTDREDSPRMSSASRARLDAAFASGQRGWVLMSNFCDMKLIAGLDVFAGEGEGKEAGKLEAPSLDKKITSISANFRSFAAYSVPLTGSKESLVLMGNYEWTPESLPEVVPELQNKGVIKVAQGDYHNLALTSSGKILSWGSYSSGALGLGHPQLSNTPLSAPHPPPSAPPIPTFLPPMPPMAPTSSNRDRSNLFPGFSRPSVQAYQAPPAPDKVEKPTLVRFVGEPEPKEEEGEDDERKEGMFVFHICAAGWHSGALAVQLGEEKGGEKAERVEVPQPPVVGSGEWEAEETGVGLVGAPPLRGGLGRGGSPPFRVGYAGRGMRRGVMQNPDI